MIFIQFLFLALQTFLAFTKPKYFLFTYLLYSSSFLGFLPKDILIGTREVGFFYQNMLLVMPYLLNYKQMANIPQRIKIPLDLLIVIYLYGIIQPVFIGYSGFSQSITESKSFSTIFLAHYLFSGYKSLSFEYVNKIIAFFGYYFSVILLLYLVDIIPPYYICNEDREIEFSYPTILSLFVIIKAGSAQSIKQKAEVIILILIWIFGMIKEGHAAIMMTTALCASVILFRMPFIFFVKKFKNLLIGTAMLAAILYILPTEKIMHELSQDPSVSARSIYNEGRKKLIEERPLMGYGFMHKTALEIDGSLIFAESLAFVDSGYIDLLGKFGYLGMVFYLATLLFLFFSNSAPSFIIHMRIFFLQFFPVNITWAVFSFPMGLLTIGLAVYLCYAYSINAHPTNDK